MLSARQLALLAVVTLLPVAVFAAITLSILQESERDVLEEQLRQSARTTAMAVEREIAQELAALATLASSGALERGDLAAFRVQARRAVAARPKWLAVVLADRDRQLVNTRFADGESLPAPLDPASIAEVFATGRPQVTGAGLRPEWRADAIVGLRVPVVRDGTVVQVLSAILPAWSFHGLLKDHIVAESGRITMVDRDNRIVARSHSTEADDPLIGRLPTDSVLEGLRTGDGLYEAVAADQERFLIAQAAVPQSGWTVLAGAPHRVVMAPLVRSRLFLFGGGGLALVLAALFGAGLIAAFTRRQEAERRLEALQAEKEAERRLADIAANFPGVIFRRVLYADGRMTYPYISEGVAGLLGYRIDELHGRTFDPAEIGRRMDAETAKRWRDAVERSARTLEPMHLDGTIFDGRGRPRRIRSHSTTRRDADGSVVWDGVLLDVTDLFEAERARREGEDRLAFALDGARAGLWDWDIAADRVTWSDGMWRLFGYGRPMGEPSRDAIDRVLHPDDRDAFWRANRTAKESGAPLHVEFRVVHPDGEIRWIGAIGRCVVDEAGRTVRMTGLDIDITDRKRIESQLHHAKEEAERASVAKSKFLAAASHDLRQPVQSLLFFSHVLSERLAGHGAQELVGTMQQALDALKGLLDGILDLSKLDAGVVDVRRETVPLSPLLNRIGAEYAPRFAQKGLTLKVLAGDAAVDSDPTLLGRIVGNLVENALKYTAKGGVLIGCRRRGDRVRIEVWDTGVGIPPGRLDDIFEEFVQVGNPERDRTQGLGLGLAIVKRLSRLLDHPMSVRSVPGRGSVFAVTVPLRGGAAAVPAPAVVTDQGQGVVALIDDEAIILEGMQAMLDAWGFRVIAESDLESALERLAEAGVAPDAVVADYRLRGGRTGGEAIQAMRTAYGADLPAVVLTGDTGPELEAEARRAGFAVLHKPVRPDALRRLLRELIQAGGRGSRATRRAAD